MSTTTLNRGLAFALALLLVLGTVAFAQASTGGYANQAASPRAAASEGISFELIPLVDALLLPHGVACDYGSGTAVISLGASVLSPSSIRVIVNGTTPDSTYKVSVLGRGSNYTAGQLTTDSSGSADYTGQINGQFSSAILSVHLFFLGTVPTGCINMDLVSSPSSPTATTTTSSTTSSSTSIGPTVTRTTIVGPNITTTATVGPNVTATTTASVGPTVTTSTSTAVPTTTTTATTTSAMTTTTINLLPVPLPSVSPGYKIGNGTTMVTSAGGSLAIAVSIHHANPSTEYSVTLTTEGTTAGSTQTFTLGSVVTDSGGNGKLSATITVTSGGYFLLLRVYDETTFSKATLVMQGSSPSPVAVSVGSTASTNSASASPTVFPGSADQIYSAIANDTIPAVVHLSSSGSQFEVLNSNFSVSVGNVSDQGVTITVSGVNGTGPRTFLFDLNGTLATAAASSSLRILFDGEQISEAASLSQVLSPQPGEPATYVLVQTAGSVQLLVTVPHFSTHTIEILGITSQSIQAYLTVDLPVLAISTLAVTLVFATIYATRRRPYAGT